MRAHVLPTGSHSSLTSDLSVVRRHCRRHTLLGMIGSHMRRAGAEATLLALTRFATSGFTSLGCYNVLSNVVNRVHG